MIPGISDVKTIVAHAGCADGITAAYLVKRAISRGFNPEVKFVQYNTIEHDNLEATKGMLFVDMTPPRARVQEFVDVGAIVLDHHEGARDIVAAFGDRGIFGENSRLESGAMLAYLHVVASMGVHDSRLHDIAMMAAVRDTFKKDHQYWSQSCAYREGLLAIFDGTMSSIVTHFDRIIVTGEILIESTRRKVREVREKNQFTRFECECTNHEPIRVITSTRLDLVSDVADEFADECDLFIAYSALIENGKPCVVFGLRSSNGSFRCDKLAKVFGGGGHPKAAGFKMPGMFFTEQQWQEIIHTINSVAGEA